MGLCKIKGEIAEKIENNQKIRKDPYSKATRADLVEADLLLIKQSMEGVKFYEL